MKDPVRFLASILASFKRRIGFSNSSTLSDTLLLTTGNVLTKGLGLVSFSILTRSLGPDWFGVLSIGLSFFVMIGDLSDLGVNASLVRFGALFSNDPDNRRLKTLISISLRFRLIVGSVIFLLGFFLSKPIAIYLYRDESLTPFVQIAFSSVFIVMLLTSLSSILIALQKYKQLLLINFNYVFFNFLGVVVLFFIGLTALNAFVLNIGAALAASIIALLSLPKGLFRFHLKDPEISKKMLAFGKWMSVSTLVYIIYNQINIVMVTMLANTTEVGYYSTAFRIIGIAQIVTGSYTTILNSKLSSYIDPAGFNAEFRNSFLYCFLIGILYLFAIFLAPFIIPLLAGDQYNASIPILQMLLAWMILSAFTLPFSAYLYAKEKSFYLSLSMIAASLSMAALNTFLIPLYGALGAAISLTASQVLMILTQILPVVRAANKRSNQL